MDNFVVYQSVDEEALVGEHETADCTVLATLDQDSGIDYWILQKGLSLPVSGGSTAIAALPRVEAFWSDLDYMLKSAIQLTGLSSDEIESLWVQMRSLGQELYDKFVPSELKMHSRRWLPESTILFATNEKWIPWELIHDGDDFWGSKFILARVPKIAGRQGYSSADDTVLRNPTERLARVVNVIGGELSPPPLVERLRSLFKSLDARNTVVELRERSTLHEVLVAMEGADVVHFTCHGHTEPTPCFQLADLRPNHPRSATSCLAIMNIRQLANIDQSIVFANACSSSEAKSFLGELRSFGWEFYKKGSAAFIATLGLVPTHQAVAFAGMVQS